MNPDSCIPEPALPRSDDERRERNKILLLEALQRTGATSATVSYYGSGDEGCDDGATAVDAQGNAVDLSVTVAIYGERSEFNDGQWTSAIVQREHPLDEALGEFAMEAVSRIHGGWENNNGGEGQVVFDCADGIVRIEHDDFYIESDHTETTL